MSARPPRLCACRKMRTTAPVLTRSVAHSLAECRPVGRYYTRDMVGDKCPGCGLRVPVALLAAGITVHPTCLVSQGAEH